LQERWQTYCVSLTRLPGWKASPSDIESCAAAAATGGCTESLPAACQFILTGTLAVGATCQVGAQCQSGGCTPSSEDGGGASACGTCSTLVPLGGSCSVPNTTCGPNAYCGLSGGAYVCLSESVDAGPPLPTVGAGAACDTADGGVCGAGLTCTASYTCETTTYAAAGQPCDVFAKMCLVGDCTNAGANKLPDGGVQDTPGICPAVIPDGQPCDPTSTTSTCDTFAQCIQGSCQLALVASTCM
jgi:hypothetical protein